MKNIVAVKPIRTLKSRESTARALSFGNTNPWRVASHAAAVWESRVIFTDGAPRAGWRRGGREAAAAAVVVLEMACPSTAFQVFARLCVGDADCVLRTGCNLEAAWASGAWPNASFGRCEADQAKGSRRNKVLEEHVGFGSLSVVKTECVSMMDDESGIEAVL